MFAAYIQVHFRLDFFMESNNMNPDQTAPREQSDLGPYCLKYKLPKIEQTTEVLTGWRRVKWLF